ncbi:MFS transporter [Dermatobacter hominis]|uniref:MFS transporter n=1 Tax=Dermatobacter hominis TaxID=2884263 RepID=UPI001D107282|nr:MFS transporter [Dermatobacter hominis]UDY34228.1 MFS transporter [Dermatobacter hominis]
MTEHLRHFGQETFASLRVRNFRLFFVGQGISQVGNWMTMVAQSLLVLSLTDSGVALGLLAVAQFGPILVLGPWAGLVADRSDKRRLLIVVQSLAMLQSFLLAIVAFTGGPVWTIYAVAFFGGLTVAFDNPARRAFVVEMVPEDLVPNAVSLNSALMTSSRVIGPALAGLLITTAGYGWAFLLDGISYIAVIVSFWMMRTRELRPSPVAARTKGQIRESFRYVRRMPELFVPLVMMGVVGTLAFNFNTVMPLFVTRDLDGTDAIFTILFSVVSVGSLVGALVAARRTEVSVWNVGTASLGFGVSLALLAIVPNLGVALPVGLLLGVCSITFLTMSTAIVQLRSAPEMRGRVLALQAMLFLGSTPIGGPIVGWVAQEFGARWSLVLGAVACLAAGAWGMAVVGRDDRGRSLDAAIDDSLSPTS